jgi:hypothetical protein
MDLAKIADGAEVGPIAADDGSEGQLALASGGDLAAGTDAHGTGVEQQGDHHGHVEGGLAAELAGVMRVEGRQIELRDESDQEEDEVVLGECIPRRDRVVTVLLGVPGTVILSSAVHDGVPGSHASGSQRSETGIVPAVNGAVQIPRSRA